MSYYNNGGNGGNGRNHCTFSDDTERDRLSKDELENLTDDLAVWLVARPELCDKILISNAFINDGVFRSVIPFFHNYPNAERCMSLMTLRSLGAIIRLAQARVSFDDRNDVKLRNGAN